MTPKRLFRLLRAFQRNERGATAIEYGMIAALLALSIIAGVQVIATETDATFDKVTTGLKQ